MKTTNILGTMVANANYDSVLQTIDAWTKKRERGHYVCLCPVHSIVHARKDSSHREALDQASLCVADGVPVVWAQRLFGPHKASQVYGPHLMLKALSLAAKRGYRVAVIGGAPEHLPTLQEAILKREPNLQLCLAYSPPFRPLNSSEKEDLKLALKREDPDIVFIGLGCPKQEKWMQEWAKDLRGTQIGVGAAFDFIAGSKAQAPSWIRNAGFEWLFRCLSEPRRLFLRYATTNPRFVVGISQQWILRKSRSLIRRGGHPS